WWWYVPPGLCIALLGTSLALINFGIDEFINPRLRAAGLSRRVAKRAGVPRTPQLGFTPVVATVGGADRETPPGGIELGAATSPATAREGGGWPISSSYPCRCRRSARRSRQSSCP